MTTAGRRVKTVRMILRRWLHRFTRFFVVLLTLSMLGCAPQADTLNPLATKDKPAESSELAIEVAPERTARTEFARARDNVKQNYKEFLEREPVSFGAETLDEVGPAVAQAWDRATSAVDIGGSIRSSLPLIVVGVFLVLLVLLDRQAWRLASRAHARAHSVAWQWLCTWLRVVAAVAGRTSPPVVLVALSYFPVQAVFGRAPWTHGLTTLLWLLVGFRAISSAWVAAFAFDLFEVEDRHAERLLAFGRRTLRLVFLALSVVALAEHFAVRKDVRGLVVFGLELSVLVVPVYLLFIKSSVMALLPEPEGGFYARLHRVIQRYFRAIVLWSAFLLALRAIGYVYASTFILVRGYGLLLMIVLIVAGGTRLRRWLERREATKEEHKSLINSLLWALRVIALLTIVFTSLRLLLVWDALVIVLEISLVNVGGATISAFSIIKSILFFFSAILLARFVRAILVLRVFPAFEVDVGVAYAVQTLVNYALIVIGFFVALVTLGVNLSAMTVVLASLGVGIGFGLQTITENLISGFILLFGRSVKKGDVVTVGDAFGQVHAVGARSVLIRTNDNFDLLIPSKEIVGGRIVNWSYNDTLIRLRLPVGVTYDCKPREVEKVLLDAALEHPQVLKDPAPEVWLDSFGDSSVNFTLLVYFDCMQITRDRLKGQLNFMIWDALHEADIEIPFPQRDLHLRSISFADQLPGASKPPKLTSLRRQESSPEVDPSEVE